MVTDLSPPKPPPRAPETTAAPAFWPQKAGWVLADRQVLRGRMVSKEFGVVDGDHRGRFDLLGTTLPQRPAGPAPFSSRALWRYFWVRVVRNPARPWRLSRRDAPVTRGRPALGRLSQSIPAPPHSLDVIVAIRGGSEFLAYLAHKHVNDLKFRLVHAAIELV